MLERKGKYETALAEISDLWPDPDFLPDTAGRSEIDAAEILLRFAALLGFCGHNRQLINSQQRAKDILTGVRRRFIDLGDIQKTAECENYIALCYWRTGELNEASVWAELALSQISEVSETRLYSLVIRSLIRISQKRYQENIADCESLLPLFFNFQNAFLSGSYSSNIGISFKNAGRLDDALKYFELARHYHGLSGHRIYLGTVENNLAQLYRLSGKFAPAHSAVDAAVKTFRLAKDRTREGFARDTKALIYLAERKFKHGLDAVEAALAILRRGENAAYTVETLQTKFKLQLFSDDIAGAVATLHEAIEIACVQVGDVSAKAIFENFRVAANEHAAESQPEPAHTPASKQKDLQLVLPAELSRFEDYQGLWINNSRFESAGLTKGSLAVIVHDEIKPGDLVAIAELESGLVSCGFYDEDFGIICLEGVDTEPELFDTGAVKVLGKIVGVCRGVKDENGQLIVEPLNRLT
jgi:tetratricopeptide (TPR) repeat protein